jgi:hypothetical protein
MPLNWLPNEACWFTAAGNSEKTEISLLALLPD